MDGGRPDYQFFYENLPRTMIMFRDWAISEQKAQMLADPAGTARAHIEFFEKKTLELGIDKARTIFAGINEPPIWIPGYARATDIYTDNLCTLAAQRGMKIAALNLSVGWVGNNGPDTPPDWSIFPLTQAAIKRGGHYLVVHEYWADMGPSENWGWWAGRVLKCPWQVPIVIGECGVEMLVKYPNGGHKGWQGTMSADRYAREIHEYATRLSQDPRIQGINVFTADYQSREWESFDIEPCYPNLIALPPVRPGGGIIPPVPNPVPPSVPVIPPIHPLPGTPLERITQRFNQGLTTARHNGVDFGVACGTPVRAILDGTVAWADYDTETPSYGNYVRVYHPSHDCHSFYAHLPDLIVKKGDKVQRGQHIGSVGSTGNSTGCHLHFEIRLADKNGGYVQGTPLPNGRVDPETWCIMHGLDLSR